MHLGVARRQLAAPHELGDERVVVGQLLERVAAQHVGARVADVAEGDVAVRLDERDRHRRPHAARRRVVRRALVHAAVRLLDELDDAILAAALRLRLVQRAGGERRGDLAGPRAAHAVGDREQRRPHDERVLVLPALPSGVGRDGVAPELHVSNLRSVSPMRTTSPGASRRSRVSRMPFTNVPFVEPMSSTQIPSRRGSMRAWRVDAYSSSGSGMSFVRPRPNVIDCVSSDDLVAVAERGAREHDEPPELARLADRDEPGRGRLLRPEDHRLLRQAQVARRGADDPPDEEVEKDEERDLQDEQRRLDLRRCERAPSGAPARTRSPSSRS